jgi:H+/Na+-translocating ferredoxin:NAD+ oxidoreductase subunit B
MSDEVYQNLRAYLHSMPGGYPKTKSGVEIKILEKLFTPDEAALFLELKMDAEKVSSIAGRVDMDESELAEKLEDMAVRGLIFRVREGEDKLYKAFQFFIGIIDAQVNRADAELADMMLEYFPALGMTRAALKSKQMRVIPAKASVDARTTIQTYNNLKDLISDKDLMAVVPCLCRQMADAKGRDCKHTRETCLSFGEHAQYYIDNGVGRKITKPELMEILEIAEKEGLVINTGNSKDVEIVCCCCSCCCGVLSGLRMLPQNGFLVNTCYQAKIDAELCTACGDCTDRCAINAIDEKDDVMQVNAQKCIGCALCVSTCPEEAISLVDIDTATDPFEDVPSMLDQALVERGLSK